MTNRHDKERRVHPRPYRSPDAALWLETYLATKAIIMGVTGGFLNTGQLAIQLRLINEFWLWGWLFFLTGSALLVTCVWELYCRHHHVGCVGIRRFAVARELFNVFTIPAWGFGMFTWWLSGHKLVLVPSLCALAFVTAFIILWINVRAQFPQDERRRNPIAHVSHGSVGS